MAQLKEIATPGLEGLTFTIRDEVARTVSCVKRGEINAGQVKAALQQTVLSWRQSIFATVQR